MSPIPQNDDLARPDVRDVDELWAWTNTWGDLYERHDGRSLEWKKGYEQAIGDLFKRLSEMGVGDCSDEAWNRFTGRGSH